MQIKSRVNLFSIFHPRKLWHRAGKTKMEKIYVFELLIGYHSLKQITKNPLSVAKLISSFYVNGNAMNSACLSKNVLLHVIICYWMNYSNLEGNFCCRAACLGADVSLGSKLSEEHLYLCQATLACTSFPKWHTTLMKVHAAISYQPVKWGLYGSHFNWKLKEAQWSFNHFNGQ